MNGLTTFKRTIEQSTETMPRAQIATLIRITIRITSLQELLSFWNYFNTNILWVVPEWHVVHSMSKQIPASPASRLCEDECERDWTRFGTSRQLKVEKGGQPS